MSELRGDALMRSRVNDLDVYVFDETPFAAAPRLNEATVAIVTTAGLRHHRSAKWDPGDESFSIIPSDARDLTMAHMSPNFDRTGFLHDINVVFPIDRLHELASQGAIAAVAPRHISFMGAQLDHNLHTMRLDTGPQAAKMLRDDGVDVVLLTPV